MQKKKKKLRITRVDARKLLFDLVRTPEIQSVPLAECLGRVMAEDVLAEENVPSFAKSPLDGYAIRGEDTAGAAEDHPVTLRITEEIPAGGVPHIPITEGYAAKILTGAPVPEGANVVVRYENTEFTDTSVTFYEPVTPDKDIVPAGDDIPKGSMPIRRGEVLTPALLGILASLGYTDVNVYKRPYITILSTGSELVYPDETPGMGQIRSSSYHLIRGYLEELGAVVAAPKIVHDGVEAIARAMEEALEVSDAVFTTGGVSVGDYDLVPAAAEAIGARKLFWKVRFRPGGTMLAAEKGGKLILGLSGNPGSASLALHLMGIPFVKALSGRPAEPPERIRAELLEPIEKESPYGRLVRGALVLRDGRAFFLPVTSQGNGAISSLVGCDLIADIPPETPALPAGAMITAYHLTN